MSRNPYARLRELSGHGQREFERRYGFSHTVMVQIEIGLYPNLSTYMIEALGMACYDKGIDAGSVLTEEYGHRGLQDAYHAWQTEQRKLAKPMMKPVTLHQTEHLSPMHFFVKDTTVSLRGFCRTLKVPTATLARYITGKTKTMPAIVELALLEAGIDEPFLSALQTSQSNWTAEHA